MANRFALKSAVAVAAVTGAIAAAVVGATGAQAATGWTLQNSYPHWGECLFYGQQGEAQGNWSDYSCAAPTGAWGENGIGYVELWVRH